MSTKTNAIRQRARTRAAVDAGTVQQVEAALERLPSLSELEVSPEFDVTSSDFTNPPL